jgi:hypothetical protein
VFARRDWVALRITALHGWVATAGLVIAIQLLLLRLLALQTRARVLLAENHHTVMLAPAGMLLRCRKRSRLLAR